MATKLKISQDNSTKLQFLSNRLDLRRNLVARIAFCYSLNEPELELDDDIDSNGFEFNRITITGKYDPVFRLLLCEREKRLILDEEYFPKVFKAYLEKGIELLYAEYLKINSPGEFLQHILTGEKVQAKLPHEN